jgi:hypothetical protein
MIEPMPNRQASQPSKVALSRDHGARCPDGPHLCTGTSVTPFLSLEGITCGCKRLDTTEEGGLRAVMRLKPLVVAVAGAQWRSGSCPLVKNPNCERQPVQKMRVANKRVLGEGLPLGSCLWMRQVRLKNVWLDPSVVESRCGSSAIRFPRAS